MTESHFRDLTRKAMIREYLSLKNNTISLIDATNDICSFIDEYYEEDDVLNNKLEAFDQLVDNLNI